MLDVLFIQKPVTLQFIDKTNANLETDIAIKLKKALRENS